MKNERSLLYRRRMVIVNETGLHGGVPVPLV